MTTADRIDAILKKRKISRRKAAIMANIPPSTFQSAMERGGNMSVDMMQALANALQIPINELIGTVDEIDSSITEDLLAAKQSFSKMHDARTDWERRVLWGEGVSHSGEAARLIEYRQASKAEAETAETALITIYRKLNDLGKAEAMKRLIELSQLSQYQRGEENAVDPQKDE